MSGKEGTNIRLTHLPNISYTLLSVLHSWHRPGMALHKDQKLKRTKVSIIRYTALAHRVCTPDNFRTNIDTGLSCIISFPPLVTPKCREAVGR
jgi:hypothetical protein